MKRLLAAFAVVFLATNGAAFAQSLTRYTEIPESQRVVVSTKQNTRATANLIWNFGDVIPKFGIGVVHAKVKPNGDTTGGNGLLELTLANGNIVWRKIKVQYMDGDQGKQAMGGVGFDFATQKVFLTVGRYSEYNAFGVDVGLKDGFTLNPEGWTIAPYGLIHTKVELENKKTTVVTPAQCVVDPEGGFADDTCTTPYVEPVPGIPVVVILEPVVPIIETSYPCTGTDPNGISTPPGCTPSR